MYLDGVQPDKCNGSVMLRLRSVDKDDEVGHGGSKATVETWSKTRKRKLVLLRLIIIKVNLDSYAQGPCENHITRFHGLFAVAHSSVTWVLMQNRWINLP